MSTPHGRWPLSFYTCIVRWTGERMVLEPENVRARLATLQQAGIHWIGVDGINAMEPTDLCYEEVAPRIAEWFTEHDLRLSSLHFAGPTFAPLGSSQEAVQHNLLRFINLFSVWRPRSIVIHADWILGANTTEAIKLAHDAEAQRHGAEAVLQTIAANLKLMARAAAAHGIRLALENMGPFDRCSDTFTLPRLVAMVAEPNVGYCIDSGHAHLHGENVAQWIMQAGARLFETHFHDNRSRGLDEHLPVGFGTISWPDVILALDAVGFEGPVTFETGGWPGPDPAQGYRRAMEWWYACGLVAARLGHKPDNWWTAGTAAGNTSSSSGT